MPQTLKPNDKVAIIATARKANREDLKPAIELLEKWKLQPVIGSSIGLEEHQFAGSDEQRAKDLQEQLNDPEIKAIWCAKGGYGTVRILDRIDFSAFKKNVFSRNRINLIIYFDFIYPSSIATSIHKSRTS